MVLEEAQAEHEGAYRKNRTAKGILLAAQDPAALAENCRQQVELLQSAQGADHYSQLAAESRALAPSIGEARVGFVAETPEEAVEALQTCVETLRQKPNQESWELPKGIYYRKNGMETQGRVVALFSGQGSQYLEMGRELAVNFPTMRQVFGSMDELFIQDELETLSGRVYPRPVFDQKERDGLEKALQRTEHAQPAIGTFSAGLYLLLQSAGFQADFSAGHSFGELTALWAGGVLSEADFYTLAKARGKAMAPPQDPGFDAGTMMAVKGSVEQVRALFAKDDEVTLANWNSNNQVVIAGCKPAMEQAKHTLESQGFQVIALPVSAAFHTPLVGHAQKPFAAAIHKAKFHKPKVKVYANGTGQPHPDNPAEIKTALEQHILKPVLFRDEIQNIYEAGGRIFVEFGPKNVLTNLVGNILEGKPYAAVALNANAKKDSDRQLREAVMALRVVGLPLGGFDPFEETRPVKPARKKSPVTVQLNGGFYISEKTRRAYEDALNDGWKVSLPQAAAAPAPIEFCKTEEDFLVPMMKQPNGNGKANMTSQTVELQHTQEASQANNVSVSGVERLLEEFQVHQSETLRLHEQYLRTEEEYARAFAQLTLLQTELVSKGSSAPGELQSVIPLFESLERSMARFHEHQSETLRVHERYLETQDQFSQSFVQGAQAAVNGSATFAPTAPLKAAAARPVQSTPAPVSLPQRVVSTSGAPCS